MITFEEKQFYTTLYEKLADALDLTDTQYALANDKYKTMGDFLCEPGTLLAPYRPEVKLQGSLRTGTPVRPINEDEEFDVDMTCILHADKDSCSQFAVKQLFKRRLEESAVYKRNLDEEHRRCWRIKNPEVNRFHLDVVPALPDDPSWVTAQGVPFNFARHTINITDNQNANYRGTAGEWPKSNTEGFALWFLEVMKEQLQEALRLMSKTRNKRIEDIPEYKARTPLQRVIQILKRHRDLYFTDDCDNKPVSVIITTLAARSYQGQANLYDALTGILDRMASFIEPRNVDGRIIKWVPNPVNPKENFADKWQTHPNREAKFYRWLQKAREDFSKIELQKGLPAIGETLKPLFGTRAVNEALNNIGKDLTSLREAHKLTASLGTATLGINYPKTVPNHIFHGTVE